MADSTLDGSRDGSRFGDDDDVENPGHMHATAFKLREDDEQCAVLVLACPILLPVNHDDVDTPRRKSTLAVHPHVAAPNMLDAPLLIALEPGLPACAPSAPVRLSNVDGSFTRAQKYSSSEETAIRSGNRARSPPTAI